MDNVIVLRRLGGGFGILDELDGVFNHGNMLRWKVEIFNGKFVHDRVNLDNSGLDAVLDKCSGGGTNSKATASVSQVILFVNLKMVLHDKSIAVCIDARNSVIGFNQTNSL